MIKNPERDPQEASKIPDWRAKLPKDTVIGWRTYEGPEVPTNPADREALRTKLLDELWELKEALQVLPRHLRYTPEQFEEGFNAECLNQWLPVFRRLDAVAHHWRHLYPGIDITRRSNYADLTKLMNDLPVPGKLAPRTFKNELFNIASHFRTYDMCYFNMIDDAVLQQKLTKTIKYLTIASDHYNQDWRDALERRNEPTQFGPPT